MQQINISIQGNISKIGLMEDEFSEKVFHCPTNTIGDIIQEINKSSTEPEENSSLNSSITFSSDILPRDILAYATSRRTAYFMVAKDYNRDFRFKISGRSSLSPIYVPTVVMMYKVTDSPVSNKIIVENSAILYTDTLAEKINGATTACIPKLPNIYDPNEGNSLFQGNIGLICTGSTSRTISFSEMMNHDNTLLSAEMNNDLHIKTSQFRDIPWTNFTPTDETYSVITLLISEFWDKFIQNQASDFNTNTQFLRRILNDL